MDDRSREFLRVRRFPGEPIAALKIVSEDGQEYEYAIGSSAAVVNVGKVDHSDIMIVGNRRVARKEFQIVVDHQVDMHSNQTRFVIRDWATKNTETLVNGSPVPIGGQRLVDGDAIQIPGLTFYFRTLDASSSPRQGHHV